MSKGYFLEVGGDYDVINNVFIDAAGVEQTLDNNFLLSGGGDQQIFFDAKIPMWPATLVGHPRLFKAIDQRVFTATDERVFKA